MYNRSLASLILATALITTGCAPKVKSPDRIMKGYTTETQARNKPNARAEEIKKMIASGSLKPTQELTKEANETTQSIKVTQTLDKSILGQEFIYNLDLQYSSQQNAGLSVYNQSYVVGDVPVRFRIAGDELELVTDNKLKYPSDVNHPEDLISRMKILSQTDTTITVSGLNSAPYLATQFGAVDSSSKQITYLDHWIRSFEYIPQGNYILQETSIKLGDGTTIGEFMESVFPRKTLAPGPDFQKIPMDPTNAIGGTDGIVARFRFLPTDAIYAKDQSQVAYVEHFDLSPKADGSPATIDWYVTPNIPDQYLTPVKLAVEGWNRYFTKMKGIERPVMRFMGRLPQGVHIGDPRYNVINWDSIQAAGAAYESQASDPETGKQSHSLIYMPAAWVTIGSQYWAKGVSSDSTIGDAVNHPTQPRLIHPKPAVVSLPRLKPSAPKLRMMRKIECSRDLTEGARLMASGRLVGAEVQNFGIELLKQSLFHELGHSLGLAHNFEGSLSFDRSKPDSLFSTSIMDYNDYEVERKAFDSVDSSKGPLLEYDRQALSAVYNDSADIASTDPLLPACNDAEADNEKGGVNPLCIRYDLEKDPTQSITTAINRIDNDKLNNDVTLSEALSRIPDLILTPEKLQAVHSSDDLVLLASQFALSVKGSLDFYLISGNASLVRTVRTNIKSLMEYDITLPDGYDAASMRERVFTGIQKVLATSTLPDPVHKALIATLGEGLTRFTKTPLLSGLPSDQQQQLVQALAQALVQVVNTLQTDVTSGLPAARAKVLLSLARHKDVDFFLGKEGSATVDYEKNIVGLLSTVTTDTNRTALERVAAALALATYKGRLTGNDAITAIKPTLMKQRAAAATNDDRLAIEMVLKALALNE